jgi:hypothetical protein
MIWYLYPKIVQSVRYVNDVKNFLKSETLFGMNVYTFVILVKFILNYKTASL